MAPVNSVDAAHFRMALARFASGVTVVTARGADGTDHGMTVSAFTSLSLQPPLVVVCLDVTATLLPHLEASGDFALSILAEGQEEISRRFADQTIDRFAGVAVKRADSGAALIEGALAHLECRRTAVHAGGDHLIIVGEVLAARVFPGDPLLYFHRSYGRFDALPDDRLRMTGEF